MGYLQLRLLFDLLCDGLQEEEVHQLPVHFEGAYGLEMPTQVLMVFVFREGLVFCRFLVQDNFDYPRKPSTSLHSLSMDEYLDMKDQLKSWSGGVSELFA